MNDVYLGPAVWVDPPKLEPCIYWMNSEGQIWRINANGEWEKVNDL